ncbi:MAG: transcription antitermination factor NusB [Myxococcota bacterium]
MRRQARQWALMNLYALDVGRGRAERSVPLVFASFGGSEPIDPNPSWDRHPAYRMWLDERLEEARSFAKELVEGVEAHRDGLDAALGGVSRNWRLDRMAILDRNVLRLAAFELLHHGEKTPRKVVINEAVELAKTFGTKESGAFVNGILDRIGRES